ncbi:hypothetical protein HYH03_005794 [Edaphochlamys debaryana]|uniref:BACK domain-containing protein n=1 Tax=Edaphochlamys debaryana TaxID=47281 RepID=A0A836C247_9CHLO|nr:hypothetical protein HYH03_005794 [Edaphochlamys debaryana]|eukprot:KAG2496194.1 hypothetical protein HYH03_005794 [Edaphochlamys debaryana]
MAPPAVNPWVAEALSRLFGSEEGADCDIQLCLEGSEETGRGAALGPLLPAHSFVLRPACERFRAQIDRWQHPEREPDLGQEAARGEGACLLLPVTSLFLRLRLACKRFHAQLVRCKGFPPAKTKAKEGGKQASGRRPLLRVLLGSEAELPAARLAIRFGYTGQVHASSVREALEVLPAGDYLAIEGCAAACSQWLADRLAATGAAEAGSSAEPAEPAFLQLYACEDLWPSDDLSFAAVLSAAKPQLVRHFSFTLAALNTPSLRQQLEALGPQGLEALLESDDLGTDSEDSVLTLLATWMRANWARTDAATRKRLCGLVRLTQLSLEFTNCLLLPLAADYETKGPEHQAGWFPISSAEAAFVSAYHSAPEPWRKRTREAQAAAGTPGWHSAGPRKQCVPEQGLPFLWSISKEELRAKLEGLQPGQSATVFAAFSNGAAFVLSRGFAWDVYAPYEHGKTAARLYMYSSIPAVYKVPGSRMAGPVPKFPVYIDASLSADRRRQGGEVSAVSTQTFSKADSMCVDWGWGLPAALPLLLPQPAVGAAAAAGGALAGWAEYEHEGSAVTSTLTLLPPKLVPEALERGSRHCSESSVLLLLARWVSERHALRLPPLPGDPSLERLCRLVRLGQLGPAYLTFVLPYIPWFPMSKPEMAFLLRYAAASDVPQGAPPGASQAPTATQLPYNTARKALAAAVALPAGGLTLSWTVSREDLVQGIKSNTARHFYLHAMLEHPRIPRHTHAPPPGSAPGAAGDPSPSGAAAAEGPDSKALALVGSEGAAGGSGSLGGSAPAAPPRAKMVTWRGLEWGPFARGGVAAGLAVPGAKLVVYRWRKGVREMGFSLDCSTEWESCSFNRCYGNSEALCLSQATQSQAEESTQGGTQAAVGPGALVTTGVVPPKAGAGPGPGRDAELLEGWREYLHEGAVRGCVVLMPAASPSSLSFVTTSLSISSRGSDQLRPDVEAELEDSRRSCSRSPSSL